MHLESRIFKPISKELRHTQYDALATLLSPNTLESLPKTVRTTSALA